MGYYDGNMKVNRQDFANHLRDIAEGVESGSYSECHELRDELLSCVDDLYCCGFDGEDYDDEEDE